MANKNKAAAYRRTEQYRQARRMYNMRPEVQYRKQVRAEMKKKLKGQ